MQRVVRIEILDNLEMRKHLCWLLIETDLHISRSKRRQFCLNHKRAHERFARETDFYRLLTPETSFEGSNASFLHCCLDQS